MHEKWPKNFFEKRYALAHFRYLANSAEIFMSPIYRTPIAPQVNEPIIANNENLSQNSRSIVLHHIVDFRYA